MTDKFDNSKPNIVLISDVTDTLLLSKSFGVFKIARELRLAGFEVAVLHHAHIFSYKEIKNCLSHLVNENTLFVGINNMFYLSIDNVSDNELHDGGIMYGEREAGALLPHGRSKNKDLINHIKQLNSNCKIVLGGPMAQDSPVNKDYDYVVIGYADISVVNLANFLLGKEKLNNSYKSLSGPMIVDDRTAPNFDFVNSKMEYKSYDCILPGETLPLEVSRGCIFQCAFCAFPLNGKSKLDFIKLEDSLVEELLNNYKMFNVTRYFLLDDTFNDSVEKVEMMHRISKRLPFKLEYWAYLRLDLLNAHPHTVELLFDSGLRGCQFGVETFNKKTGEAIGKGLAKEKQIALLKQIKARWQDEIMLYGSFIVGAPHETIESLEETFSYLMSEECALDSWQFYPLSLKDIETSQTTTSRIDKDPNSFGYTILKDRLVNGNRVGWKSEYMDNELAAELAKKYNRAGELHGKRRINGFTSFSIAGLGFDLSHSCNKSIIDFDWHLVNLRKQSRAIDYKTLFYKNFKIPI